MMGAQVRSVAGAALLAAALAAGWAAPAAAQSRAVETLQQRLDAVQRDLQDLQRQVYGGRPPPSAGGSAAPAPRQAETEIRLNSLENELRNLTGRVEQVDHQMRQLTTRLDKLVGDIDYRLLQLEQRAGIAAPGGAGDGRRGDAPADPAPADDTRLGGVVPAPAPPGGGRTLPDGSPMEQYDYAFALLRRSAFGEAEQAFRDFLQRHPEDRLAGNAQYWLGETHYVRGQLEEAAVVFVEGYRKYPDSAKATDTLLKLGMTLRQLGQNQEACATFGEFDRRFPDANPRLRERVGEERRAAGCG